MYLHRATILNSGPIADLELIPQFTPQGLPKPMVLVGANGSGKTNVLSIIADALVQLAVGAFPDVAPAVQMGHEYLRVLGSRSQRLTSAYEVAALRFRDGNDDLFYRAKVGNVQPAALADRMVEYPPVASWQEAGNEKQTTAEEEKARAIFQSGAYAYFPTSRYELPHWVNASFLERDPEADFAPRFTGKLRKPIVVQTSFPALKPWLIDVILDQALDSHTVLGAQDIHVVRQLALQRAQFLPTYININQIFSTVLGRADARVVRTVRGAQDRRLAVAFGNEIGIPSLDNLSAGQSSLVSIFATLVRYGEIGSTISKTLNNIEGICLVDEIDAHLHSDLQHDALPRLIKLLPKVQFIVTAHSPLLPLGLQNAFEAGGISIIELPGGATIDAEIYSEFARSLEHFRSTRAFETSVQQRVGHQEKALILCEGETDPR
jgi:predicted ATPase